MAALNELIQKIENPELRAQIQAAADRLTKQKKFGLVFEEHLPECTPMYDIPVRKGLKVSVRNGKTNETYTVLKVAEGKALCLSRNGTEAVEFDVADLVTTAELGDPIYPCLQQLGEVCNAPDSELWHTLIEADNYHALQLLEYLYAGKVDCIYIDPPYNSGATDWKYNNKYVDEDDEYRHSKWLSFMQKRLQLAKKLLAKSGVLIATIDEHEVHHLRTLLEEIFPECHIQMITDVINPKGVAQNYFARVEEYIIFVFMPEAQLSGWKDNMLDEEKKDEVIENVTWASLLRRGNNSMREDRPKMYYPILIDVENNRVVGAGDILPLDQHPTYDEIINGYRAAWPVRTNLSEGHWSVGPQTLDELVRQGYVKLGGYDEKRKTWAITYLFKKQRKQIESGEIVVTGFNERENHVEVAYNTKLLSKQVKTVWNRPFHDAGTFGSSYIANILDSKRFTYPKSLYAVRDAIGQVVGDNKDALVLDFFAGSGTTLHAVNLLNKEDGGRRCCIMVTNNEISEAERKAFEAANIGQDNPEWESRGIARYVTWPRTVCSIKGVDIHGEPLRDSYLSQKTEIVPKKRSVTQISFIDQIESISLQDKKRLVSLISHGILPVKLVEETSAYIVSEETKHSVSILLDDSKYEEWLETIEETDHIQEFFVITKNKKLFNIIKKLISSTFEPLEKTIPLTIPMSDGFKSNAVFFKLGFLDKTKVSLGMQFKELLSTLWMKAGAIGKCPTIDAAVPDMLILPENKMAVLTDENRFCEFAEQLAQHPEIKVVYLVTDYESSFVAMTQALEGKQTYQLYRDYLDNFRINAGRNSR